MDDKTQIRNGAFLSDFKPVERLDTERSYSFVSLTMGAGKQAPVNGLLGLLHSHKKATCIASFSLVVAAIAAVLIISRPNTNDFGSPAVVSEQSYIHSAIEETDDILLKNSDTTVVKGGEVK